MTKKQKTKTTKYEVAGQGSDKKGSGAQIAQKQQKSKKLRTD